jgi:endoglucanase
MASSFLLGVNLSGAEFGSKVPGVFGTDYTYPTHAEIDYYASKGMGVIRLPFLWERLQRTEYGSLDATELGRLDGVVNYAIGKGLKIEIEPHDFGYGFGALIGSAQTPNSAFADFWGKLALHFQPDPNVIFGLMNEPHDQSASAWLGSANAAIAAIRNAGAVSQEILVPGSYWDGAWTWTSSDNAAVVGTGVQDPAHNFAFEVHQYLDADGSGTHSGVVSPTIGAERVTAITQWAQATGNRLFLGEVGVSTDQTSLTALDGMLTYIQQHTNVWEGVTFWAGGPWWGNYMYSIEPQNGVDKPQMTILLQHLVTGRHAPRGDFNSDGTSDILFRNDVTGDTWYEAISNGAFAGWNQIGGSSTSYAAAGVGEFYGTSTSDVLYRNNLTGDTWLAELSNGAFAGWHQVGGSDTNYKVVGVGHFFGGATDDILYRDNATGDTRFAEMSNGAFAGWHQVGGSSTDYKVVGVGDFNGDGTEDILYRDDVTGDTWYADISNGSFNGWHQVGGSSTDYKVVGTGDFAGDGASRILYRNNSTGDIWFADMSNGAFAGWHQVGGSDTNYSVVAVGDYFGNGTSDILFRNNITGDTWLEAMSNGGFHSWEHVGDSNASYAVKT